MYPTGFNLYDAFGIGGFLIFFVALLLLARSLKGNASTTTLILFAFFSGYILANSNIPFLLLNTFRVYTASLTSWTNILANLAVAFILGYALLRSINATFDKTFGRALIFLGLGALVATAIFYVPLFISFSQFGY